MRRIPLLLLAALTALLGSLLVTPAATAAPGFTTRYETIPGEGGTPLKAFVIRPTGRGPGPHPLLVLPSSWGVNNLEYVGAAWKMAYESGYVVVSYTSRGFWDSGGEIGVAGPTDVADARRVIDWAIEHAGGDPARVGMAGISYGSGISLLTAAADRRVRAVSAMSGWADLAASLYPNHTVSFQAVELLMGLGHLTGRPGPELRQAEADYRARNFDKVLPIAPERSVSTKVDQINANRPAVMIAHPWQDGIFPPSQLVDFYNRVSGPKRLMLSPGDHATPELFGAAGFPNEIWENTRRWFDHHLRGVDNGIDRENPVHLKPNNGGGWRSYPSWEAATGRTSTFYLTQPTTGWTSPQVTGSLAGSPATGWTHRINTGWDTAANSGTIMVSGMLQGFFNIPTGVWMPQVNRADAGVWWGPSYDRATTVNGAPRLHTTVTPSAATTTLYAYLYDVGSLGDGALITHKPLTLRGAKPGVAQSVDIDLEPVTWNVPAGHRLVLVVDTVDPRYVGMSQRGATVTFGSPEGDPSWLRIPTA